MSAVETIKGRECHMLQLSYTEEDAKGRAAILRKSLPRKQGWKVRCVPRTIRAYGCVRIVFVIMAFRDEPVPRRVAKAS